MENKWGLIFIGGSQKDTRTRREEWQRSRDHDIIYEHNDSLRTKKPKLDTIVLVSLGSKTGRLHEKQETLFIKENREMVLIGFSKPFFSKEGLIQ